MNELEEKIKNETIGKIFISVLLFIIALIFGAFTTWYLWDNIMVTLLGFPKLNWIQVLAIDTFASYLIPVQSKKYDTFLESAIGVISKTALYLLIGFVLIQFI